MTTRQHALFSAASIGPDLDITQGGEVLAPANTSLTNERTARASVGQTVGAWNVEFLAWGSTDPLVMQDPLSAIVGIVTEDASLSDYVGADAFGLGYELSTGNVYNAGATLATVTAATFGDIIGLQADLAAGELSILINGELIHTEPLPSSIAGAEVFPAASMGSDAEADGRLFMNAGQRAFEFPQADSDGWYSIAVTIDTLRFAEGASYFTAPTDEIPNVEYVGCIADSSVSIVRALNFWPWGDTRSRGTAAQLTILDPDGEFDSLIGANIRDLEATIHEVPTLSTAFADADLVGSFVLDRVEVIDDGRKRLTFRDRTAVLDQPVQNRLFLPNLPEDVANRPVPICLGVCRSVEPVLLQVNAGSSSNLPTYQVADAAVQGFGLLRDKGDPLSLAIDWAIREGQQQIELFENPFGKLTLDVSSVGGDALTNIVPTTLADWDTSVNVTGTTVYTFGNASQTVNGTIVSRITENAILTAGRSYGFVLVIDSMSEGVSQTGVPVRLSIGEGVTSGPNGPTLDSVAFSATSAGTYTGSFTAVDTGPITLALRGVLTITNAAVVSRFEVFEAANTEQDTLQPITLEAFAREILQTRGGLLESQWSAADAAAIDTATGYGMGWHTREPVSVADALQAALVGFGACYWQDASGVIRFTRIVDPATLTPAGEISQDVMLSDLAFSKDEARGLTAQIAGRRNWTVLDPTDIVTDYVEVPFAVRRELTRRFRAVRTTGVPFPSEYAHARGATDPLETLIDEPTSLQAEIDRVAALYSTVRYFYQSTVPLEAIAGYELGQAWTLRYPRYGLSQGKDCLLVAVTEDRINQTAIVRLWG